MFKAIFIILKDGFANTIKLTIVTFIFASLIGLIVALIKIEKVPVSVSLKPPVHFLFQGYTAYGSDPGLLLRHTART